MHIDAETEEDAVRQFLADLEMIDFVDSYRLRSDIAIDVRDIASGEDAVDAVKLTYI